MRNLNTRDYKITLGELEKLLRELAISPAKSRKILSASIQLKEKHKALTRTLSVIAPGITK